MWNIKYDISKQKINLCYVMWYNMIFYDMILFHIRWYYIVLCHMTRFDFSSNEEILCKMARYYIFSSESLILYKWVENGDGEFKKLKMLDCALSHFFFILHITFKSNFNDSHSFLFFLRSLWQEGIEWSAV